MAEPPIDTETVLREYENCPALVEDAIRGLSRAHLDLTLQENEWSIREITHHVVDGDDLWKTFIKQALGNPGSEFILEWYWQKSQLEWGKHWNYQAREVEPSLALFQANRTHIAQLLRFSPEALDKTLRVCWPKRGEQEVSVSWVVVGQTRHVQSHIADIRSIRERHGV